MGTAAQLIEKLESKNPNAVQLAKMVSLAMRIETELLRKARLELLPGTDAGAEADLWFSDLVESRNPAAIVFRRDVSDVLRENLAENQAELDAAWQLIETVHKDISPAVFAEEKLTWLALSGRQRQMQELLRSVVATMIQPQRAGLLEWAARAFPRLPAMVRESEEGQMLAFGLSLRLEEPEGYDMSRTPGAPPEWAGWLTPSDVPMASFGVRLVEGAVEFGSPGRQEDHLIELPKTAPILIELSRQQGAAIRTERVRLDPGKVTTIDIAPRIYISHPPEAPTRLGDTILAGLRDFFGWENVGATPERPDYGGDSAMKIEAALRSCHVMLVLIDPARFQRAEAGVSGQTGGALELFRMELGSARTAGLKIIPVLLDGAPLPGVEDLPQDLAYLTSLDAFVYDPDSGRDLSLLIAVAQSEVELQTVLGQRYLLSPPAEHYRGFQRIEQRLHDIRAPRVEITYEVESGDTIERRELPFVVGAMADLSGKPAEPLPEIRGRKFVQIDRDNFEAVMKAMRPRAAFNVRNRFADDEGGLQVDIRFESMDDFSPERVALQVAPIRKYVEIRRRLAELSEILQSDADLYKMLQEAVSNPAKLADLGRNFGVAIRQGGGQTEDSKQAAAVKEKDRLQHEASGNEALPGERGLPPEYDAEGKPAPESIEPAGLRELVGEFIAQLSQGRMPAEGSIEDLLFSSIDRIDEMLTDQLNEILHHFDFQKLEAAWRGLYYLVMNTETGELLQIKVLNASKDDLLEDLESASEFDDSALFKLIHDFEFFTFGGTPYGVLIGDYEIGADDRDMLFIEKMAQVAAAAHAPFITAAAARLFGFESYTELAEPRDLAKIFENTQYRRWRAFRESEDSRYVCLVLPHILMRLPYGSQSIPVEGLGFEEDVDGDDHRKYLWGNAAFALGTRITDAFAKYHWCAAIRGVEGGGLVMDLPLHTFETDQGEVALKCPTEIAVTERREKQLADLGFMPLVHAKGTDYAAFFSTQTTNKPAVFDSEEASANARLASQLQYVLPISRFAHYIKCIFRDKVGSFMSRRAVEEFLNRWIMQYVVVDDNAGLAMKAKHPLREAKVDVSEIPEQPGAYRAVVFLKPHYQLDELTVSLRLVVGLLPPPAEG